VPQLLEAEHVGLQDLQLARGPRDLEVVLGLGPAVAVGVDRHPGPVEVVEIEVAMLSVFRFMACLSLAASRMRAQYVRAPAFDGYNFQELLHRNE
jgi:hypothetical protein